jgi:hypothetical protein
MESATYDLVISGGTVMDPETGLDAVRNVGITGGTITAISEEPLSGEHVIDASGHVVSPGFIDGHVHTVDLPLGQKIMLRGGVTTQLDLEAGAHPVDRFYNYLAGKSQANYGACVNTMAAREQVFDPKFDSKTGIITTDMFDKDPTSAINMDWRADVPNDKQIAAINQYLEAGLKQGALGVGVPVGYMTEGATSAETTAWSRLAGKYGRATYVHGRFSSQQSPTTGIVGFEEMIAGAAVFGGGVFFHHMHQQALADTIAGLELFDDARARGLSVVGEIYPYNYGASIVGADYLRPENYGPNMGRSYKDIIETATLKPLTKERYEDLIKSAPMTSIMFYGSTEDDMYAGLAYPTSVVGSDSFPLTVAKTGEMASDWDTPYEAVQGHPRQAGTSAKMLRLAREKKLVPLMTAISKMSYMVAKFLEENGVAQMAYKGRIQVGADADITIFDPDTVTDNSTMQQAGLPATGIPHVVVNGTVVVKDSKVLKDVYPGRPVRLPVLT